MVWLNSHNVRDLRTPFGGVKASGLGHEGGYRSHRLLHRPAACTSRSATSTPPDSAPTDRIMASDDAAAPRPPTSSASAYMELVVTDLAASREFYVDVLGLVRHRARTRTRSTCAASRSSSTTTWCCAGAPSPRLAPFAYRVRSPDDVGRAEAYFTARSDCRYAGASGRRHQGIGDSVRVEDPLGFPFEFFYDVEPRERLTRRYDLHRGAARSSGWTTSTWCVPDVPAAYALLRRARLPLLGDDRGRRRRLYAAWMYRKQTVHDIALTGGAGPRLHHLAFWRRTSSTRFCTSATSSARCDRSPTSSAAPAATACRTPSTSTCAIRTATASRSTRSDYYTGDPDHETYRWTCTTTSAATGGATRSSSPGTPRPLACSTSTARSWRSPSRRSTRAPYGSAPTAWVADQLSFQARAGPRRSTDDQKTSSRAAAPWPPPMHMVTTARRAPRR